MKLLVVVLSAFCISFAQACSLVPEGGPSSCQNLNASPLLNAGSTQFGPFIEGAAVNARGQLFATNYGNANTLHQLGQFQPGQRQLYADSQTNSYFNGIRFFSATRAFAADINNHRVVELTLGTQGDNTIVTGSRTFCQNSNMLQPNDLAISRSGTIFTSGMNWVDNTNDRSGDIWSCTASGQVLQLETMGRTNGIELSPDETRLYVSESHNQNGNPNVQRIWVYNVDVNGGLITNKRIFADFAQIDGSVSQDIDGMRTDTNGNLYVTRNGGGKVTIFNPNGQVTGTIQLNFQRPTNLEFGGPQGNILYIVGSCEPNWPGNTGCVDQIQMTAVGRAWRNLQ